MKVGLVQSAISTDKALNLTNTARDIAAAATHGAELVVLPEMFCVPYTKKYFEAFAEEAQGDAWKMLAEAARTHRIWLIGGSISERLPDGTLQNVSYVFNPQGEQVARHAKIHLFDIDIKGGQQYRESDTFSPGTDLTVFDSPFGRIGLAICFDIRFADLALEMVHAGAEILVYPAAFNPTTGPLHWELLFRGRAVDGQCYTIGVAPARQEVGGYTSWAHSIVVDPWGKVLLDMGTDPAVEVIEVDVTTCAEVRSQIPIGNA